MNCVVDRITFFKQVLADTTKTPTERQEALQFIVHFVGDVHQPFHAVGDARGRERQPDYGVWIDTMREPSVQPPLRVGQRDDHAHWHGRERLHTTVATVDHGEST